MPFEIAALVAGTVLGLMAPRIKSFCDWVAGKNAVSGMTIVDGNRYVSIPKLCALEYGRYRGLKVIGAHRGAGKSTIVLKELKRFVEERCINQNPVVIINSLRVNCIHDALRIRPYKKISDFVAKRTMIIIFQVDLIVANKEDLRDYILSIADDSISSGKYFILMCMSTPESYREVLTYNGGISRISEVCEPSGLKWNKKKLEELIDLSFPEWSDKGKNELLKLTIPAMSPGVIVLLRDYIRARKEIKDFVDSDEVERSGHISNVKYTAEEWEKFDRRNWNK